MYDGQYRLLTVMLIFGFILLPVKLIVGLTFKCMVIELLTMYSIAVL